MRTLKTDDGVPLHWRQWNKTGMGPARGTVLIVHGLGEHVGRYEHVAAHLNHWGWHVVGHDQRGHGASGGARGDLPHDRRFEQDLALVIDELRADATLGAGPLVMLGHSMGGLIATLFLIERQQAFVAAALSGPAILPAEPPSRFTVWISRFLSRFFPRLGVLSLDATGVSRDPAVVAAYRADPLVYGGKIGARLGKEFMDAMAVAEADAPKIRLPILIQHGEADRLTAPAGSRYLFEHVSSVDKRLEIYPGLFHEIYNEPERDAVLGDLIGWFDAHVAGGARS